MSGKKVGKIAILGQISLHGTSLLKHRFLSKNRFSPHHVGVLILIHSF